jgi:parallel beta-helix repeat protein
MSNKHPPLRFIPILAVIILSCGFTALSQAGETSTPNDSSASSGAIVYFPTVSVSQFTYQNILENPGFEIGTNHWSFFTDGSGQFSATQPSVEGSNAAKISILEEGENVQLFQSNLSLLPNEQYRLEFYGRSNSGHDLSVSILKHGSPYTNYGLNNFTVNLTDTWERFSTEFTTENFNQVVDDARLRFWLSSYDAPGDNYYIDAIVLSPVEADPPPAVGEIYYVAKNNPAGCSDTWAGTEAQPWCSIQEAGNSLRAGETVFIKEGIYYERVVPDHSGSNGNHITYQNFGNDEVIIDGSGTGYRETIRVEGLEYLRFKGFTIRGDSIVGYTGFRVEGPASHIVIEDLTVEGNYYGVRFRGSPNKKVTDSSLLNSIVRNNSDTGVFVYRTCENILIDGNIITGNGDGSEHAHGVHITVWPDDPYPTSGPQYVTVSNNEIGNNFTQGVLTWVADYILIKDNYIHHNGATGIQIEDGSDYIILDNNILEYNSLSHQYEGGIWIDDATNVVVQNNISRRNKMGILVGKSDRVLIRNNVVHNNNEGYEHNINAMGVNVNVSGTPTRNTILVHNTLWNNGHTTSHRGDMSLGSFGVADDLVAKNNIVSESASPYDLWVTATGYESDYNNYHNTRTLLVRHNNRDKSWSQYLSDSTQDGNSITTNPLLVDPENGDFSLRPESPAKDGGSDLTITITTGNGKAIPVEDARYFFDGFGLVEGDLIQVGSNNPVRIIEIDYYSNIITVDTSIIWNAGDEVSYPYSGFTPDIGALEFDQ